MGVVLTLAEAYERNGGQTAVDALVAGADDPEATKASALEAAERDAWRFLNRRYVWPADAGQAPEDLKDLVAQTYLHHVKRSAGLLEGLDREELAAAHEIYDRVIGTYRLAAQGRLDIEGLVEQGAEHPGSTSTLQGVAVKPPAERRPVDAGAMNRLRRIALGGQFEDC